MIGFLQKKCQTHPLHRPIGKEFKKHIHDAMQIWFLHENATYCVYLFWGVCPPQRHAPSPIKINESNSKYSISTTASDNYDEILVRYSKSTITKSKGFQGMP
jgi:hypothetical protein